VILNLQAHLSHITYNGTGALETNGEISLCSIICRMDRCFYGIWSSTAYTMCSQPASFLCKSIS